MSVRIIADSASDITYRFAKANNIDFAPLKTVLGNREYRDGIDILPNDFYDELEDNKELARTSQVNPTEFLTLVEQAVKCGHEVIVITISSGLSGTYFSAKTAAANFPGKVFVVDSLSATAGEQILVRRAITLRDQGKSAAEIFADLQELRNHVRLFVRVETLEYLKRGGRVSKAMAIAGSLLHVKPLLTLNSEGKLELIGIPRGNKMSHRMLNKQITACGGIDFSMPIVITYAGDLLDGTIQKYLKDSQELYDGHKNELTLGQLGCVIGTHTGPGAIVVSFVAADTPTALE